jgi:hypothetical protein
VLLLCLALSLAGASLLHAEGQAEPRLATAEKLIQQKDYADALKLLAAIQRENPELRDETSTLMARIRAIMQHYNSLLAELGEARAQGDSDAMERLLPELQDLDPSRTSQVARTTTGLASFLRLMNRAEVLLKAGKPRDALDLYVLPLANPAQAGFDMQAGDFDAAGYGSILVSGVHDTVARLTATAKRNLGQADAIAAAPGRLHALFSRTAGVDSLDAFDSAAGPLLDAAAAEGAVRTISASLSGLSATIRQAEGKGRDDPYLQYLLWLCNGRAAHTEGLLLAIRMLWADSARNAADDAAQASTSVFARAREQLLAGALFEAAAGFDDAYYRSILAVKAAAVAAAAVPVSAATGMALEAADRESLLTILEHALTAQESAAEVSGYRALMAARKSFDQLPLAEKAEVQQLASARSAIDALQSEAARNQAEWESRAAAWDGPVKEGIAPVAVMSSAQGVADLFKRFSEQDLRNRDIDYAVQIARIGGSGFADRLAAAVSLRARGEDERDGTKEGKPLQSVTGLPVRRPDLAAETFTRARADLDSLIADIGRHEESVKSDKPFVTASMGMEGLFKGSPGYPGYDEILAGAQRERESCATLAAGAQSQMDQAAVYSREGDTWFTRALASLTKNDPDAAVDNLDTARISYVKSLAVAYSDHAASRIGKDQDELSARIQGVRNNLAIQRAQRAITAITKKVTAGDYLGASDDLDAATTAWDQTQADSYPPFDTLRQNIRNALELNAGRDIKRSDPKADVVNAFIKNAQDNLAAGRLADAQRNVKDALAVAPNYGAAKVLELMIRKQTDPVGFQKEAQTQIATYVAMAGDSTNPADQNTALRALQDYSNLDPKLKAQLAGTIQELRYALKLDPRPATPQQIRQANALVERADTVQQQGTSESYQAALDILRQALQVVPNFEAAIRLDGQVRTKMGSTTLSALSGTDSQRYNQALNMYLSGAYQDSYGLVLGLWDDPKAPRNKTYGPLQKLKKRLEVALNIS